MRAGDDDRLRAQAAGLRRPSRCGRRGPWPRSSPPAPPPPPRSPAARAGADRPLLDRRVERVEVGVQDRRLGRHERMFAQSGPRRQPAAGAARERSCRRRSPSRSAYAANVGAGPRQRRSADVSKMSAPVRSVARSLKSSARSRRSPSTSGGKSSIAAVLVHEPRGGDAADPGDARIAVGRVADEGEQVGDQRRLDAELLAHAGRVADRVCPAVDLHHAVAVDALRQVLVGRPDADLLDVRRPPRRCARPRPARRRPRARPSATRPRPSPRAPPRAARTAARSAGSTPAPVLYPGQRSLRNDSIT